MDQKELFINHTLWSRNDERIFCFVRGDFEWPAGRLDVPLTMRADGSDLRPWRCTSAATSTGSPTAA